MIHSDGVSGGAGAGSVKGRWQKARSPRAWVIPGDAVRILCIGLGTFAGAAV